MRSNFTTRRVACPRPRGHAQHCGAVNGFALLALVMSSVATGCGLAESDEAAAKGSSKQRDRKSLVRVATIEQRKVPPKVVVVGSVVPRWSSVVASGADGVVELFKVEEGQYVERGHVLSVLRTVTTDLGIEEAKAVLRERKQHWEELQRGSRAEDIAEAKAKMLAAEAIKNNSKSKLVRAERLFGQNALGQDELDDAIERSNAAKQIHLATTAVYERTLAGPREEEKQQVRARYEAQVEQVKYLEAEKQKRTTKAPFNGFVVRVQTFVGQWLSKGDPVITLAMLEEVDVVTNVDQRDLRHIHLGETVDVLIRGSNPPIWRGKIAQVVSRSDWRSGSRAFPVEVRLQNRFHTVDGTRLPELKEGMMAEVTFQGDPVDALLVPKDALIRTSRGTLMYLFDADENDPQTGSVRQVIVELGISEGTSIQVIAKGIAAGMQVVTEGAERLRPFQNVQIAPEPEKKPKRSKPPGK